MRLSIELKTNDYGNRINFEIKNKNSKNIMDCRARLKKLVVFSSDGREYEKFNEKKNTFHFSWNEKKSLYPDSPWPSDPVREKTIISYDDESFELIQINQLGWEHVNFSIELHSCEGNIEIVSSEQTHANYSIVEVGILLELIFDFEDETKTSSYSQRIRFDKKLVPVEENGKIIYHPSIHNFYASEWKDENA